MKLINHVWVTPYQRNIFAYGKSLEHLTLCEKNKIKKELNVLLFLFTKARKVNDYKEMDAARDKAVALKESLLPQPMVA